MSINTDEEKQRRKTAENKVRHDAVTKAISTLRHYLDNSNISHAEDKKELAGIIRTSVSTVSEWIDGAILPTPDADGRFDLQDVRKTMEAAVRGGS